MSSHTPIATGKGPARPCFPRMPSHERLPHHPNALPCPAGAAPYTSRLDIHRGVQLEDGRSWDSYSAPAPHRRGHTQRETPPHLQLANSLRCERAAAPRNTTNSVRTSPRSDRGGFSSGGFNCAPTRRPLLRAHPPAALPSCQGTARPTAAAAAPSPGRFRQPLAPPPAA